MILYNCHAHVFNLACVPRHFLDAYAGRVASRVLFPVLQTAAGRWLVRAATRNPFLNKYGRFLAVGTLTSQQSVFERLVAASPAGTRFVVLTLNFDHMGAGLSQLSYEGQLTQVLELRRRYPDTCLPFVCLDPRQGSAPQLLDFLKRSLDRGFVGIKLYPALGFFPFDPRLELVYRYAEAQQLPIVSHCTKGGIYYVGPVTGPMASPDYLDGAVPPAAEVPRPFPTAKIKNGDFCDNFLRPAYYEYVLRRFPNLKLCLAHYGGELEILRAQKAGGQPDADNWYAGIRQLMQRYPQVYTDVSYTLFQPKTYPTLYADLHDASAPQLRERILFGTDYYMVEQETDEEKLLPAFENYLLARSGSGDDFLQLARTNPRRFLTSAVYEAP